jgi:hypothetical protein
LVSFSCLIGAFPWINYGGLFLFDWGVGSPLRASNVEILLGVYFVAKVTVVRLDF